MKTTIINKSFKAAVLRNIGQPLSVENVTFKSLGTGQVLVKVIYSGVCRSQVMECDGGRGHDPWLPHLLGHEAVGQVVSVGADVTKVKEQDVVVLTWINCTGREAETPLFFDSNENKINAGKVTTFAEYCIVGENKLFKKPQFFPDKIAVLLGCALRMGAGMVLNEIVPERNQKVAIIGLGGVGLSCLIACLALGVSDITVFDISTKKLRLAEKLGASNIRNTAFINVDTFRNSFDICYEAAGRCETIEYGFSIIKETGTLLFASHPSNSEKIKLEPHELIKGKKIYGSWGGGGDAELTAKKLSNLLLTKKLDLSILLGKTYSIDQINEALNDLRNGNERRPIIEFSSADNANI